MPGLHPGLLVPGVGKRRRFHSDRYSHAKCCKPSGRPGSIPVYTLEDRDPQMFPCRDDLISDVGLPGLIRIHSLREYRNGSRRNLALVAVAFAIAAIRPRPSFHICPDDRTNITLRVRATTANFRASAAPTRSGFEPFLRRHRNPRNSALDAILCFNTYALTIAVSMADASACGPPIPEPVAHHSIFPPIRF